MKKESLDRFVLEFALNASHLALVENAGGTSAMIQAFHSFYRYSSSDRKLSLMEEELEMLQNFIRLKRISNEKIILRIRDDAPADSEIKRMSLINRIDELLDEAVSDDSSSPEIIIFFPSTEIVKAEIRISGNGIDIVEEVELI